ncbi:strictosidine synthase [Roseateles sp. GG27B]
MIAALREWTDRLLGRGDAAITVPVFDGALKSNNLLEEAAVWATLDAPEDLATDGQSVFVADGATVLRYDPADRSASATVLHRFDRPVTALACLPSSDSQPGDCNGHRNGGLAVALDGREVRIVGGPHDGRCWNAVAGQPLHAVNAISAGSDGRLVATDGSREHPAAHWKHDLMSLGRSGRLLELNPADGSARELASGLAHAFGACAMADVAGGAARGAEGGTVWASESWHHRVMAFSGAQSASAVTDALPGYPSRITLASAEQGGGYWLTCFTLRTQLVEFVLREPTFRKRMLKEIEPQYWIAPALNSGNTFLEPMQGAQLKMMGVVKPWAPPRSYGLVIRLSPEGRVRYSLHSRFDGKHHGVVAAVECRGDLFVLAKGCGRILRLSVTDAERSLQA